MVYHLSGPQIFKKEYFNNYCTSLTLFITLINQDTLYLLRFLQPTMRVKTKDCFWCGEPIFTVNLKQHEDNECEKNPYADPNNPVPPKKQQRRSM